jgi:hypothetical protein
MKLFVGSLERLITLGHAEQKESNLYVLTHSGWAKAGKRLIL